MIHEPRQILTTGVPVLTADRRRGRLHADAETWVDIAQTYRGPSRAHVAMRNADGSAEPMGTRFRPSVQGSLCSPAAVSR
jgi:hypothetical protein